MNSQTLNDIAAQLPQFIADYLQKVKAANDLLKDSFSMKNRPGTPLENGFDLDYENIRIIEEFEYKDTNEGQKLTGIRWRMPYRVMPTGEHTPSKAIEGLIQEMPVTVTTDTKTLKPIIRLAGKFESIFYVKG